MKRLLLAFILLLFAGSAALRAQCILTFNPVTSQFNCLGIGTGANSPPYNVPFAAGTTTLTIAVGVHGQSVKPEPGVCYYDTGVVGATQYQEFKPLGPFSFNAAGDITWPIATSPTALAGGCNVIGAGTGGGTGGISSVSLSAPSFLTVTGSPGAALGLTLTNQSANTVFLRGTGTGVPSFGALTAAHINGLNPVFNTIVGQPSTDVSSGVFRRLNSSQTSYLVEFQTEANGHLSGIDKTGVFVGNVLGNLTGTASLATAFGTTPTRCSTGAAPTGIDVNGNSVGCASLGSGPGGGITGTTGTTPYDPVLATNTDGIVATGTRTGNTSQYATGDNGTHTPGNITAWDSNGNLADGGAYTPNICTVVRTSSTVLTFAPSAGPSVPCKISLYAAAANWITSSSTLTITAGSGLVWAGWDNPSNAVKFYVQTGVTGTCSGCSVSTVASSPPATFAHIWQWTATSAAFDLTGGTDERGEFPVLPTITNGVGIATITPSGNTIPIAVDTTVITQKIPPVSASLTYSSISAGACQRQTMTVTGVLAASTTQFLLVTPPSTLVAGVQPTALVTADNTVSVEACNHTGSSQTPSGTYRVLVLY